MTEFEPRWTPGQQGHQSHPGQQGFGGQHTQPVAGGWPQQGYRAPGAYPGYQPGAGNPGQPGQPGGEWRQDQPGQPGQPGEWQQGCGHQAAHQQTAQWPAAYQPPRRRPLRTTAIAVGAVGLSVLIGLGIGRIAWTSGNQSSAVSPAGQSGQSGQGAGSGAGSGGTSSTSLNPSAIAAKVNPGLVDVNTVIGYQSAQAAGTGVVLTANGEILTNNHVVEGATSIKVTDIGNGRTYRATVVGYDRTQDIAVLQLQGASGLATDAIGDSNKVSVGDAILGIGNAGGAGGAPSVAQGTVTALNQQITASDGSSGSSEQLSGLIQVNANIQSGDSGGSLVNSAGQIIGVDTAASTGYQFNGGQGGAQQGGGHQGFAIPINQALGIAKQIVAGTASTTVHIGKSAFLGVSVSSTTDPNAQGGRGTGPSGAVIQQVLAGSPVQAAGMAAGDVITSLNGQPVDSANTLTNLMDQHHPGDSLTVTWLDQAGQSHTATVSPIAGPVG